MDPKKLMGFETPADQRVPVSVREWTAMKLAMWRSFVAFEIAAREAVEIIARCRHAEKCPGENSESAPCWANCPDRELRMSALVILNAARSFAPVDARKPNEPYFAPSRERFSEVMAELGVAQIERDALREVLRKMGVDVPTPPPVSPEELPQLEESTT